MPQNVLKINEKLENPALRGLMEKYRGLVPADKEDFKKGNFDQEALTAVMNEIADEIITRAKVLVPATLSQPARDDGEGGQFVPPNTNLSFVLIAGGGRNFLPVFTETEEFLKWQSDEERPVTVQMDFDSFVQMAASHGSCAGIVINPFSDNLMINREMLLKWYEQKQMKAKGHANYIITRDTPVELYTPAPYPIELSGKLCETARGFSEVNKIWLRGIKLNNEQGYLLVVDFKGDRTKLFTAFGDCAKPFLGAHALHIVALDDGFGAEATDKVLPIYTKD